MVDKFKLFKDISDEEMLEMYKDILGSKEIAYSPMTWNTMSRTRSRVSHSTSVKFCHGPMVSFLSTNGMVINGDRSAALICDEPLSSCHVS